MLRPSQRLLMHEGAIVTSKNKILPVAGVLLVTGAIAAGLLYAYWDKAVPLAGMAVNYVRTFTAPSGTTTTKRQRGRRVPSIT